jgi:6-phosphogluconolactonase (cycloisomerase 2 family)
VLPRITLGVLAAATLAACSDSRLTDPGDAPDVSLSRGSEESAAVGGVFVSTNSATGNGVVAFDRMADGSLRYVGTFATGGVGVGGTADPLTSQYALTLSRSRRFLFVVNAGSNEVSSFAVQNGTLRLVDRVASGGVFPVSVAASNEVLYVLHAGSNTITGFTISRDGALTPRADIVRPLGAGAAGAAAIRLSRDGRFLTVTERSSNTFSTYLVSSDGALSEPTSGASAGLAPFGFDYTPRGQVIVSEAAGGSVSSYAQSATGALSVVSAAAPTLQRAPCWLIVDASGRFAYSANAGSATLTGFRVDAQGALTRIVASGISADLGAGAQPLDLDMSRDGKFLYVFENGTGTIAGFRVVNDGFLHHLADTPGLAAAGGYMGLAAF